MTAVAASLASTPVLQRVRGAGRLAVRRSEGKTRLAGLFQEGSCKIRLPRGEGEALEAVLINTSGGMTGGDIVSWHVEAQAGAAASLTTQACEKIYRSTSGAARLSTRLVVGAGARLDWLPQETILFDNAALHRTLDADLAADATLLCVEAVVLGREAMGETVRAGSFRDRWRVRREGRLIFADDVRLDGAIEALTGRAAVLAGARAFATLLLTGPDCEARLAALQATFAVKGVRAGAGAFDGKLVCRLCATDGLTLRRVLIPALAALRDGAAPPRVWRL
jgi:urease accessory protein